MIKDKEKQGEREILDNEREKEPIWSTHIREKRQSERWSQQREGENEEIWSIFSRQIKEKVEYRERESDRQKFLLKTFDCEKGTC